jgi:hypothetical protein
MKFEDCELAILRNAVDETEKIKGEQTANSEDVKKILAILESFLKKKRLVCYGGTAINNILPKHAQFYNRDVEIPDYDFFSANALQDAKELADIYYQAGYVDIEAKSGVHQGTFKVFVNFIPIADITMLDHRIYANILKESIVIEGIHYAPPNYLRMAVYLELSRPEGDVSRWEKIMKRLNLLNEYYPFEVENCQIVDFQRNMDYSKDMENTEKLYFVTRDALIQQGVIFFGGYATSLYSKYMPEKQRRLVREIPDFDVLSTDYEECANAIKKELEKNGFQNVTLVYHEAIGEIVPKNIEIVVNKDTVVFIYTPIACHSYNEIQIHGKKIRIATIDTILTFYLSFVYTGMPYHNKDRLLCMAKFLFEVEQKNRLKQNGLLKRFTIDCYGKQMTLQEIRAEKAEKYKELKNKRDSEEFELWFLNYKPDRNSVKRNKTMKQRSAKTQKTMKRTTQQTKQKSPVESPPQQPSMKSDDVHEKDVDEDDKNSKKKKRRKKKRTTVKNHGFLF